MRKFEPDQFYVVGGEHLNHVVNVAKRLFTEKRLANGDEYRNLAQALERAVEEAFEYPDEGDNGREDTTG